MANPASASRSEADSGASAHSSAKPSGEVIAVTVRDDFLLELGESLGGQVAVHPVDALAAALERLGGGSRRAQLLAIDSRDIADLRGDVDRAHGQMPHVPIVVFAASESEKTVAGALKSSNVFAVLPIPVDRRKTAAIFEGALADAAARRSAEQRGGGTEQRSANAERAGEIRYEARPPLTPEPAPLSIEPHGGESEPPAGRKLIWIAAAVVVAAAAGGGYWFLSRGAAHAPAAVTKAAPSQSGASASAAAPPVETPQAALAQGTLDSLLEKARLAMRERRYTEPAGNCALLYYRSALGVDPTNGEARDGMSRLATLLESRFDEALSGGRLDEAASALANLRIAAPHDAHIGSFESRLTAAQRAELAKHQDESRAKHLADLFAQRIHDGRLVEPANDSAKYYLQQLRQLAPDDPVAKHGARDLVAACLRKARDAALANHSAEADKWIGEARAAGMSAADYSAYQRDLASARQRAASAETDRLVGLARDRMQAGHLTDPAEDSAVYYLTELKSRRPDDPAVAQIGRALATRLIERATASARAGKADAASADLALARVWGADPTLLQAVQSILSSGHGRASAQAARAPAPRIPAGFVPKRTRYVAPQYPDRALNAHVSGAVTLEFTIDTKGRPRNVHVIESTPEGMFDRAAVDAVSRWRYKPAVFNGVPTEIPTRMVIRFEAPK